MCGLSPTVPCVFRVISSPDSGRRSSGYLRLSTGAQRGGAFESRHFNYDARGNRISELRDDKRLCYSYQGDLLKSVRGAGSSASCGEAVASPADMDFTYDGNGRMVTRTRANGLRDTSGLIRDRGLRA